MEFAAMKRRDLLELCRQHGLAIRGSKADLAAVLAGALSVGLSKPRFFLHSCPSQKTVFDVWFGLISSLSILFHLVLVSIFINLGNKMV
jgi:hypothetical protein